MRQEHLQLRREGFGKFVMAFRIREGALRVLYRCESGRAQLIRPEAEPCEHLAEADNHRVLCMCLV